MELHVMAAGTLTAVCYRDEIFDPILRPFAGAIGNNFILMQDNACLHTARLTMDYLYHESIEVMDWPAWLPDLNPIEHVWDYLYRQISRRDRPPLTVHDFIQAIRLEWEILPQQTIRNLILSMPRRCRECANNRGDILIIEINYGKQLCINLCFMLYRMSLLLISCFMDFSKFWL